MRPAFWEQQRPRYLLSGLMKCGCCGSNFTKYGASRFACAGSHDRGTCTNKLTIRGDELEASILAGLQTRLMEPARFEKFAAEFVAETNKQRMSVSAAKAGKEAALGRVERQIKRLVDAIADGADAMPLNAKLKELDAERARLAADLEAAPDEKPLIHPAMAIAYRQRVAALAQALYGGWTANWPSNFAVSWPAFCALPEKRTKSLILRKKTRCKLRWLRGLATAIAVLGWYADHCLDLSSYFRGLRLV